MRNIKYIKLTATATPPGHTLVGEQLHTADAKSHQTWPTWPTQMAF